MNHEELLNPMNLLEIVKHPSSSSKVNNGNNYSNIGIMTNKTATANDRKMDQLGINNYPSSHYNKNKHPNDDTSKYQSSSLLQITPSTSVESKSSGGCSASTHGCYTDNYDSTQANAPLHIQQVQVNPAPHNQLKEHGGGGEQARHNHEYSNHNIYHHSASPIRPKRSMDNNVGTKLTELSLQANSSLLDQDDTDNDTDNPITPSSPQHYNQRPFSFDENYQHSQDGIVNSWFNHHQNFDYSHPKTFNTKHRPHHGGGNDNIVFNENDHNYDYNNDDDDYDNNSQSSDVSSHFSLSFPTSQAVKEKLQSRSNAYNTTSTTSDESDIRTPVTKLKNIPYVHGGYASTAPLMLRDRKWMLILEHLMPEAYEDLKSLSRMQVADDKNHKKDASEDEGSENFDDVDDFYHHQVQQQHQYSNGRTSPSHDNNNSSYYRNPFTKEPENPDSPTTARNRDHSELFPSLDPLRVMKWAENNPVVAAFGMLSSDHVHDDNDNDESSKDEEKLSSPPHHDRQTNNSVPHHGLSKMAQFQQKAKELGEKAFPRRQSAPTNATTSPPSSSSPPQPQPKSNLPALEWDVFLDPSLVKHVDWAMQHVENLRNAYKWTGGGKQKNYDDKDEKFTTTSGLGGLIDEETIVAADIEVDRQVSRLISRMMLAHGTTAHLLFEAVGMARRYNFSRVVKAGESVKRNIRKKKAGLRSFQSRLGCARGKYEDTTMDENYTYMLPAKSTSFEAGIPQLNRQPSFPKRSTSAPPTGVNASSDAKTGGVFAERWLVLFASALRLGEYSELYIHNRIYEKMFQPTSLPKVRSRESPRKVKARFLRRNSTATIHDDDSDQILPELDRMVENQRKDDEDPEPMPTCGLFLCLGMNDPGATMADHGTSTMAECAEIIRKILGEQLRLVLDLKSRNVPGRVWGRLIDNLRARGLEIDGIGSFDVDELRNIGKKSCSPITQLLFFHSAGDLQRACHANEIKSGDTVYFNAGSLLWKKPTVYEATGMNACCAAMPNSIPNAYSEEDWKTGTAADYKPKVKFQPYAYYKEEIQKDGIAECASTLADYQKHLDLKIGLYIQEFAVSPTNLDALVSFINDHSSIYNAGLAWGGLNGLALKSVVGDGFWNQRYVGRNWDEFAVPTDRMQLLAPEDHHLIQKVILAGSCGQVSTAHRIFDDDEQEEKVIAATQICNTPRLLEYKSSSSRFVV